MYTVQKREEAIEIIIQQLHQSMMEDSTHAFMLDVITNGFAGVVNYTDDELVEEAEDLGISDLLVTRGVFAGGEDRPLSARLSPLGGVLPEPDND
jgi:hypothetical protein